MHGANYRTGNGQPYTRKQYIKGKPQIKIAKFASGQRADYDYCVQLCSNEKVQIRHMAIESARLSANKAIEKVEGETGYFSILRIYPHVLLRENKMIAGAGADRLQKGMRMSFGRPTDRAARFRVGTEVFTVRTFKQNALAVASALNRCKKKLSGSYTVVV